MRQQAIWGAVIAAPFFFASAAMAEGACDFGEPAPDAPPEIHQFDFLIGNFRIEAHQWTGEAWSDGYLDAAWNGRWGIGGRAVIDEWFGPQISPDTPRGFGVNVRYFDSETGRWSMVWQATSGAASILEAEEDESGVLRMWQVYPEPASERRIWFEVYGDGHWARIDGPVDEEGNFTPQYKLEAFEVPCEG
jgi:hypothetical protein